MGVYKYFSINTFTGELLYTMQAKVRVKARKKNKNVGREKIY